VRFKHRRRIVVLASKRFLIPAPLTTRVVLRLSKRKFRLVKRLRKLHAVVRILDHDRAGRVRISTRSVVVRAG
jgi:hypothetical protein